MGLSSILPLSSTDIFQCIISTSKEESANRTPSDISVLVSSQSYCILNSMLVFPLIDGPLLHMFGKFTVRLLAFHDSHVVNKQSPRITMSRYITYLALVSAVSFYCLSLFNETSHSDFYLPLQNNQISRSKMPNDWYHLPNHFTYTGLFKEPYNGRLFLRTRFPTPLHSVY